MRGRGGDWRQEELEQTTSAHEAKPWCDVFGSGEKVGFLRLHNVECVLRVGSRSGAVVLLTHPLVEAGFSHQQQAERFRKCFFFCLSMHRALVWQVRGSSYALAIPVPSPARVSSWVSVLRNLCVLDLSAT